MTGIGAVTPLANEFFSAWGRAKRGESGVSQLTRPDASGLEWKMAGEIENFDPLVFLSKKETLRQDPFAQYAAAAAGMALADAGLSPWRGGAVVIGTSRGGVTTLEKAVLSRKISPYSMPASMAGAAASFVAGKFGIKGYGMGISNACASGLMAVAEGFRLIKEGFGEFALCGGAEAPLARTCVEGYGRMGALTKGDSPEASRPFDAERDGFVLSEGACVLVLEEFEAARKRGARIYGEVAGFGNALFSACEARPSFEGEVSAMRMALNSAKLTRDETGIVSAHASSTLTGDRTEAQAIKAVFGEGAEVPVIAVKSLTGHMLSASGPFEAAVALMCMEEGMIPPYPHLNENDSGLSLFKKGKTGQFNAALVNSFGFGGFNISLVLKKLE